MLVGFGGLALGSTVATLISNAALSGAKGVYPFWTL
jgi:hypothetical protein